VGTTPPPSPVVNQIWFYTDGSPGGGQFYVYYDDGDTQQWVPSTGIPGPQGPVGNQGATGATGATGPDSSSTGDTVMTYRSTPNVGWIVNDDGSIGSASSGATTRANADTQNLFNLLWPLAGCTITGGKGATAAADWAANKPLFLPKVRSRLIGAAGASPGAGFTARAAGDAVATTETPLTSDVNVGLSFMGPPGGPAAYVGSHQHFAAVPASTYLYQHIRL
jgi:hypothetical protein